MTYNNAPHSVDTFFPRPVSGQKKKNNCYRNCTYCEVKLDICGIDHNDQKLDGEGKKEEKVELQERNINLKNRRVSIMTLVNRHAQAFKPGMKDIVASILDQH